MGHGYSSGAGFSTAPRCQASNITIKNTGSGAQFSVTDGGSAKNIRVFNVVQDGAFITAQKDFTCDVYIDGAGRDGVRVSNSDDVRIKGRILNVQENGVTVIEATHTAPAPLGITNLDISCKFKNYSLAGVSIDRGAVFISQSLEIGNNINIHGCEFKASQAYHCIIQRHTKQVVNIFNNVLSGSAGSFILAANNARQQATAVWGNQRKLSNGNSVDLYPTCVAETGRGSGATTSITSAKYGNWSELLTTNADYTTQVCLLIDSGTTAPVFPLNFTSNLASGSVSYNYSGGGTLSFTQQIIKTLAVTP
jgi:hypothetical protein